MTAPSPALTMLIAACPTAALVLLLLIAPAISQYQAAIAQQKKVTVDNDYKHSQQQAASTQAAMLATVRPKVLELLPASDLQYDLVVQVEGLARSLAIPLTSLSVTGATMPAAGAPTATTSAPSTATSKVASVAPPASVALSVGVTGTYAQIRQFVQALPTISRSLAITQVSVNPVVASQKDAQASSGLVSATLTASAFYQLPETQKKP